MRMSAPTVALAEVYRGKPVYTGRIFVRRDKGIESIAELKGKTIAFADPISESGYLYPLDIFVEQGLLRRGEDARRFFGKVFFAGGYQQAMQAMAGGLVDAAGASQYAELLLSPEQQAEVKWIAESEADPLACGDRAARISIRRCARSSLPPCSSSTSPANRELLKHVYGPDGYVVADPNAYDGVRDLAKAYGLLK